MVKEYISLTQLFVLIFNFLLGSSIVIGLGKDAMQDAWIAIFLMTFIGVGLMYLYYSINAVFCQTKIFLRYWSIVLQDGSLFSLV